MEETKCRWTSNSCRDRIFKDCLTCVMTKDDINCFKKMSAELESARKAMPENATLNHIIEKFYLDSIDMIKQFDAVKCAQHLTDGYLAQPHAAEIKKMVIEEMLDTTNSNFFDVTWYFLEKVLPEQTEKIQLSQRFWNSSLYLNPPRCWNYLLFDDEGRVRENLGFSYLPAVFDFSFGTVAKTPTIRALQHFLIVGVRLGDLLRVYVKLFNHQWISEIGLSIYGLKLESRDHPNLHAFVRKCDEVGPRNAQLYELIKKRSIPAADKQRILLSDACRAAIANGFTTKTADLLKLVNTSGTRAGARRF